MGSGKPATPSMFKINTRASQRIIDFTVLSVAFWVAFFVRFDGQIPDLYFKRALFLWPYVAILQYIVLALFRVPSFSWRYVGLREVTRILLSLGVVSAFLLLVRLIIPSFWHISLVQWAMLPIGVTVIDFTVAFMGITGVRVARRLLSERDEAERRGRVENSVPTFLIGAGRGGVGVAKEIRQRPDLGIQPVGFIDDDDSKVGTTVHGLRVLGKSDQLDDLIEAHGVKQAIITIAHASGKQVRRIVELCERAGVSAKIIPGMFELLDGRVNLNRIREISIEDLLRRDVVELETALVKEFITNKRVLVTGAGGSIGSEICRQVARFNPETLTVLDRSEPALFAIYHELARSLPQFDVMPWLGDIGDAERVQSLFSDCRPHVVFHAAAHKHVPLVEFNPGEAIKNNIFGTKTLADAAVENETEAFVNISTDKAVSPTSVMGATKRVAEIYTQALAARSQTKFVSVRFGNVLGSTGSVVPIFKEQIANGGPVTVTHPDMKRYFMTIPEATQLVLQASAMGRGGELFTLDMGEPVRIVDLAVDLIKLSGLEPYEDIPIKFTGVRPGEKLFEELGFDPAKMDRTRHTKIFVTKDETEPWELVAANLANLAKITNSRSLRQVREVLATVVSELQTDARPEEAGDEASPDCAALATGRAVQPA